jgi:hypothetical protein
LARQIYGTIRRVLSGGGDGAPWIAEIMLASGEGSAFLEMPKAPAAAAGDDIMTMGDLSTERDGRVVARNIGIDSSAAEALRRVRIGVRGTRIDAEWKTLANIATAESHGDVRTVFDGATISVIRPLVAAHHGLDVMARHSNQNMVGYDAPRFVLDPVVYRNRSAYEARRRAALPAGLQEDGLTVTGPSITPSFGSKGETNAWLMNFGSVESCSYTHLAGISGSGMIPKFDVPSSLAHEFMTVHEFAHSMDDNSRELRMATPYNLRRLEAFADAFAVTELALAGRSLQELRKIVSCREAALIGLSFGTDGQRVRVDAIEHFSGAAARAALNAAAELVRQNRTANPAEVVRQAHKISERFTISDGGMIELRNALSKLHAKSSSTDVARWLKELSSTAKDKALVETAKSLANHHRNFLTPADQSRAGVAQKIAELHAASLKRHVAYSKENGLLGRTKRLLTDSESENWGIRNHNALRRLLDRVRSPGSAGVGNAIRENIRREIRTGWNSHAGMEQPAVMKLPPPAATTPNPWTFSVADRLKQCAVHAEQAYRVITEVAATGIPSPSHQERFTTSMMSLSSFVEALAWRDPTKDGKAVRRKLEEHPELEDYLRMVGNYSYADFGLPVDEGKRLQLQAIIMAINPKISLPEMPRPQAESTMAFGDELFPSTDRD